jgi:phosphatidylserine/phosphatidylglycerophosphate/cardiolipin synthase-like enzyme
MNRIWKISLSILFFGTLTFLGGVLLTPHKSEYAKQEILGAQTGLTAFVEPEDGLEPILKRIEGSTKQILVEVYIISDPRIISELVAADQRGVDVRVILEEKPFGGNNLNQKSKKTLEAGGVRVQWSQKAFRFTHEKTMIFDDQETCILNANLSTSAFVKNREFSVCTTNDLEVKELQNIFWTDWNGGNINLTQENIIVSPINSRGKLISLIKQAKSHIEIIMEVLNDDEAVAILKERAQQIPVRVLLPQPEQILADKDAAEQIGRSGGWVKKLGSPYLHAKLILIDGERAYIGSVNLSASSFDENREVGIIVSQPEIVQRFLNVFETDWQKAEEYR